MRVSGQTILKPTEHAHRANKALLAIAAPILQRIDGKITLSEALAGVRLTRREYVQSTFACLAEGLAVVVEAAVPPNQEEISLPPWVIARLRQDNANISQAIVDLVIWVDRVKCWMYQVDVDFGRIISELAKSENIDSDEDFFKELGQYSGHYQGPFFGESMPITTSEDTGGQLGQAPQAVEQVPTSPKPPSVEF